jgi:hypothetical protein
MFLSLNDTDRPPEQEEDSAVSGYIAFPFCAVQQCRMVGP